MGKLAGLLSSLVALAAMSACGDIAGEINATRPAVRYIIPAGYVGWVRIDYGVNQAHAPGYGVERALPLPIEKGVVIAKLPSSGHLVTSSSMKFGSARDEYYYAGNGALEVLSQARGSEMIWSKFNGRSGAASQTEFFFVGTNADYLKHGDRRDPVPAPGPIKR